MKGKKRIIILSLVVILAVGTGILIYEKSNTTTEESSEEGGHFIEVQEEEIEYTDIAKAKAGDKVRLGDFEGEMAWDVLDEKDGKLMLVSMNCIAQRAYHNKKTTVTWERSEMRKWLNETFYEQGFSKDEKAIIQKTQVANSDNDTFGTKGGKDTSDYVYLLSIDEAEKYYLETSQRMATLRDGTLVWWWLRSPGFEAHDAANIGDYGTVNKAGHKVFDTDVVKGGVRPVIWIEKTSK